MIKKTAEINIKSDADKASKGISNIKKDLKEANLALIEAQSNFGDYSKEAVEAAKKVALLKDRIQEAKETAALFDPGSKFQAFSGALSAVAGGFSVVTGAMGALGAESEDVENLLLKVNSAMALTTGLSALADSKKDFERLGTIATQAWGSIKTSASSALNGIKTELLATGIGAFVVVLGLVAANWDDIKKSVSGASRESKIYKDIQKDISSELKNSIQSLYDVKSAFEAAAKGTKTKEEALKLYNEKLGDSLGRTDSLKEAEKRLTDNTDNYIKAMQARATANILYSKAAEIAAKQATGEDMDLSFWQETKAIVSGMVSFQLKAESTANSLLENRKESTADLTTYLKEANKQMAEFNNFQGDAERTNQKYEADKKAREKAAADAKAAREKALAQQKANDEAYKAMQEKLNNDIENLEDDSAQKKLDRQKERELEEINSLKGKSKKELDILRESHNEKFKLLQNALDKEEKEKDDKEKAELKTKLENSKKEIQDEIDKNNQKKTLNDVKNIEELEALYTQLQNELDIRQEALVTEFEQKQEKDLADYEAEYGKNEGYYALKEEQGALLKELETSQGQEDVNLKQQLSDAKKKIDDIEIENQKKKVAAIGQTLANASALLGEHTLAGKALAIAATTISTYQSAVDGYKGMVQAIPGPVGIAAGAIAAAAAIASGLATVKKIVSTKVPTKSGGGGAGAGVPSAPPKPSVSFQNTPQTQVADSINEAAQNRNSQPVRAYVVSGDVTTAQSLDRNRIEGATF